MTRRSSPRLPTGLVTSLRPGPTADMLALLAKGPMHRDALAVAVGISSGDVTGKLTQRAKGKGDVFRHGAMWSLSAPPARVRGLAAATSHTTGALDNRAAPLIETADPAAARRAREQAVQARAARDIVCEVATSRTYTAPGAWCPPRVVVRAGAWDYMATPTRVGDVRLPYRGATNMSTTATSAGARSGVK